MHRIGYFGMGLAVLAVTSATVGEARADDFYLGYDTVATQNRIELCNATTGVETVIVAGNTLMARANISLTDANDRMHVVSATGTLTPCGQYDPFLYNGNRVDIDGLNGNDILTGGNGPTFLRGGNGDDHLTVMAPSNFMFAGPGDDCVQTTPSGSASALIGDIGDDCLQQPATGAAALLFACDAGNDDYAPSAASFPAACENLVATCGCQTF